MLRWSERQLAMLKAMGVQQFWPHQVLKPPVKEEPGKPLMVNKEAEPLAFSPSVPNVGQAGRAVTNGFDWPALTAAVASCQACDLCEHRKQPLLGAGHLHAHWMLVGEAPNEQEDLAGQLFVGSEGLLLDRILQASRMTRQAADKTQQVYITYINKCRPPSNRNPTPAQEWQCEPYLIREIQLVQPKLLVAIGRSAQKLLKTTEPIGQLRGRVHHYQGVPLVVTYHPTSLLHNPDLKALAWDDWCFARQVMSTIV